MINAVLSLGLLSTAVAFTAGPSSRASALTMKAERSKAMPFLLRPAKLDESMPGYAGFDPLGLANIDELGADVYWMREAELKHSRIAMLAVVGLLLQEAGIVFPNAPTDKNQIAAFWKVLESNPGPVFAAVIFLGIAEIVSGIAVTEGKKNGDRAPGEFGFNPLNLGRTPATARDLAEKEVVNGRLAMWAAAGLLAQESLFTSSGAF